MSFFLDPFLPSVIIFLFPHTLCVGSNHCILIFFDPIVGQRVQNIFCHYKNLEKKRVSRSAHFPKKVKKCLIFDFLKLGRKITVIIELGWVVLDLFFDNRNLIGHSICGEGSKRLGRNFSFLSLVEILIRL